jgi:large subunit ribosomal protein L18
MSKSLVKRYKNNKQLRAVRIRAKVKANSELPRLSVFRSNKYIFAQLIDSIKGNSLTGVRGQKPEEVGKKIAEQAIKLGMKKIVFDRGPYSYHGRVKALADAAREAGLKF